MTSDAGSGISPEEREARRALLSESLAGLSNSDDSAQAATDVVRALDHYVAGGATVSLESRERLRRALTDLAEQDGALPVEAAVGAVDEYLAEAAVREASREPAVTNYRQLEGNEIQWARWIVIVLAVMSSTVVAATFSGGFLPGGIILAIWIAALFVVGTS